MSLEEKAKVIAKRLQKLTGELLYEKEAYLERVKVVTDDLRAAAAQGDLSENVAYTDALDDLAKINIALGSLEVRVKNLEKVDESGYEPIGMIVKYTTVRLEETATGEEYIFRLYPDGISDVSKGVVSKDSPVGRAIYLREAGMDVVVEDRVTGLPIVYKIKEIY